MLKRQAIVAAAISLLAIPALRAQNLLTNGGFETGDLTGWTVTSLAGAGYDPACQNLFGVEGQAALSGNYGLSAGLPMPGCVSNANTFFTQTFATLPGVAYVFSVTWRKQEGPRREPCPGYCATYIEAMMGAPANPANPGTNGAIYELPAFYGINSDAPFGFGVTSTFSGTMVATSLSSVFQLETWSQRDYMFIDNLSVQVAPEPGTVALLGVGLLALGIVVRRRRNV